MNPSDLDGPDGNSRERQTAETLAEHLPAGFTADLVAEEGAAAAATATGEAASQEQTADPGPRQSEEIASSLLLQGGDVHRSLFRMAEAAAAASPSPSESSTPVPKHHRRAATFHGPLACSSRGLPYLPVRDLVAPQGFRRDFVWNQQQRRRRIATERRWQLRREQRADSFGAARLPIARNFVEFLELYGHFADEDLEEEEGGGGEGDEEEGGRGQGDEEEGGRGQGDEEEEADDQEDGEGGPATGPATGPADAERGERQPLLGQRGSDGAAAKAKAGTAASFFMLLKAFVGTGIMFLPKAYNNGGMLFSTVTLLVVAALSMAGFRLLLACRERHGGRLGYGDMGLVVGGPAMRSLVLGSIALSQLGFVCAGLVFVAENLHSFLAAVSSSSSSSSSSSFSPPSPPALVFLQLLVLVPLAFVRDIARLGPAALLGDLFIGAGLAYMCTYDIAAVAARGWHAHPSVAPWFNPAGYTLTVGAAIFTFEGIGLILPIQSSMARPDRFGWLLALVMALITAAYICVGALGYAAFGVHTRTEVIDNYPRHSRLVQAVQGLYALAVLAGLPVQLFPAVRILEGAVFSTSSSSSPARRRSGKNSPPIKWAKNALRTFLVAACAAVAAVGAGHLDRFVALIGSLACVPLLFIYPPYLHYRAVAATATARALDVALMALGIVAMVHTTAVTMADGL